MGGERRTPGACRLASASLALGLPRRRSTASRRSTSEASDTAVYPEARRGASEASDPTAATSSSALRSAWSTLSGRARRVSLADLFVFMYFSNKVYFYILREPKNTYSQKIIYLKSLLRI